MAIESDSLILAKDYAIEGFKEALLPLDAFSTDVSPAEGDVGDTVKVTKLGTMDPGVMRARGDDYATQNLNSSKISVDMNLNPTVGWNLLDRDFLEMPEVKAIAWGKERGYALGKLVMNQLFGMFTIATFGPAIHTAGPTGLDMDDLVDMGKALDLAEWPSMGRNAILNSDYHGELRKDARINSAANLGSDEVIRTGRIPGVDTFENIYKYNGIPAGSDNLKGLLVTRNALLVAMRYYMPEDPSGIIEAQKLTDEKTGLTIGFRRWTHPTNGSVITVLECLLGAAAGDSDAAKLITYAG